jgi:hypothetical protein
VTKRTCGNCYYFAPIGGGKTGTCCVEPPKVIPMMPPPTAVHLPGAKMEPILVPFDPPTAASRRACRRWEE